MNDGEDSNKVRIDEALQKLLSATGAGRAILWQFTGINLKATHELSDQGSPCFIDFQMGGKESLAIMQELIVRFPDESGAGAIDIDTSDFLPRLESFPELSSLFKQGDVRSSLIAQLRRRGFFKGFLELQHCGSAREWSQEDAQLLEQTAQVVGEVLIDGKKKK
jgi:GAF domain-containing protein